MMAESIPLLAVGHRLPRAVVGFLNAQKIRHSRDFRKDTAQKFVDWRAETNFSRRKFTQTSSSTVRHELCELRKLAAACGRVGLVRHWAKAKAGGRVNREARPLTVREQKELLASLKGSPARHDAVLLLLVSGARAGELKNARYRLNGKVSCPTIDRILERGHVFKISENALRTALKRMSPPASMSRLRNTFAANRLLAGVSPEAVGGLMEHAFRHTVKDLYGGHAPQRILGSDGEASERRAWVEWLEKGYFGESQSKGSPPMLLAAMRKAEESVIADCLSRFRKIIAYKGRTLGGDIRPDFESEAMHRLYRSVRLHLSDWVSGKNAKLLTSIANGALNWALARKSNRDKLIEGMKREIT